MDRAEALALLNRYYAAFNAGDWPGMLDCLDEGIVHDINQGASQIGKDAFRSFLAHDRSGVDGQRRWYSRCR
jgi:ketosteroid isomerase-like protein